MSSDLTGVANGSKVCNAADLNALATNLNEAFDNGTVVTLWASTHLTR